MNKNILYLIGGTCSGKTSLARALEKRGFVWVRSVTTRPKRSKEINEYAEWIGEAEFNLRNASGELDYVREYMTHGAMWKYGFRKQDLRFRSDTCYVMIGDPVSARRALEEDMNVVLLYAHPMLIHDRLKARGCDEHFIAQRLEKDKADFSEFSELIDRMVPRVSWSVDGPTTQPRLAYRFATFRQDTLWDRSRAIEFVEREVTREW